MSEIKIQTPKSLKQDHSFALRIFSENEQVDYRSTRIGTLDMKDISVPDTYLGCNYELKDITELKVVASGKVEESKNSITEKIENKDTLKDGK